MKVPAAAAKRVEWLAVATLAFAVAAALLWRGGAAWSWDGLNHHVYLGLVAQDPRWQLDVVAASFQSYQHPYLYWPVYRISQAGLSALLVASLWAGTQAAMLALPLWLVSDRLITLQAPRLEMVAWRVLATASAFMSIIVMAGLRSTANDLMAAVPFLWAIAISLKPPFSDGRAAVAGALMGVSVALKLSNGLLLPWLLLWCWAPDAPRLRARRVAGVAIGAGLGFVLAYAPWGWQLWRATGNPFHPFFAGWFGGA